MQSTSKAPRHKASSAHVPRGAITGEIFTDGSCLLGIEVDTVGLGGEPGGSGMAAHSVFSNATPSKGLDTQPSIPTSIYWRKSSGEVFAVNTMMGSRFCAPLPTVASRIPSSLCRMTRDTSMPPSAGRSRATTSASYLPLRVKPRTLGPCVTTRTLKPARHKCRFAARMSRGFESARSKRPRQPSPYKTKTQHTRTLVEAREQYDTHTHSHTHTHTHTHTQED
jgi:hypothetical protein